MRSKRGISRLCLTVLAAGGMFFSGVVSAAAETGDTTRNTLSKAVSHRRDVVKQAADALLVAFDEALTAARTASDDARVKVLSEERREMVSQSRLPSAREMRLAAGKYLRQRKDASAELVRAYQRAVDEYVATGKVEKAKTLEAEMDRFIAEEKAALTLLTKPRETPEAPVVTADPGAAPPKAKLDVPGLKQLADYPEFKKFSGHFDDVWAIAFSPDGSRLLTGGLDEQLILWDTATGKKIRQFRGSAEPIAFVAFSPDGGQVLAGGGPKIRIWNASSGKLEAELGHISVDRFQHAAFSSDAKQVVASSSEPAGVYLFDVKAGRSTAQHLDPAQSFQAVAFSPDGKFFVATAVGPSGNAVYVWQTKGGKPNRVIPLPSARGDRGGPRVRPRAGELAFSADGTFLVFAGWRDQGAPITVFSFKTGKSIFDAVSQDGRGAKVAISPDNQYVLASTGLVVVVWDLKSQGQLRRYRVPSAGIAAAFCPTGRYVAVADDSPTNGVTMIDLKKTEEEKDATEVDAEKEDVGKAQKK